MHPDPDPDSIIVDCGGCLNRGRSCADCAVTYLERDPTIPLALSAEQRVQHPEFAHFAEI